MNKSERVAYEYLKQRHKEEEIVFRSRTTPDFVTKTKEYEVKRRYGSRLVFYDTQVGHLKEDTVVIVVSEGRVEREFLWKDKEEQPYNIQVEDTAKNGKVVRIDSDVYKKIMQYDDHWPTALKKALNIYQEQSSGGLTRQQKEEVEMIVDQKIEDARRRY